MVARLTKTLVENFEQTTFLLNPVNLLIKFEIFTNFVKFSKEVKTISSIVIH